MTMVPAQNLSKQHNHNHNHNHHPQLLHHKGLSSALYYGGCGVDTKYTTERFAGLVMSDRKTQGGYDYCSPTDQSCVGSDLKVGDHHHLHLHHHHPYPMADDQDESRTNSLNNDSGSSSCNKEEEGGQTHHPVERESIDDHEGWLQLSIGGHTGISQEHKSPPPPRPLPPPSHHHHQESEPAAARSGGAGGTGAGLNANIELDLLAGAGGSGIRSTSTMMFEGRIHDQHHQFGGLNVNIPRGGSSMANFGTGTNFSTTSLMYFQQYYPGSSSSSNSTFPQYHQDLAVNNWPFRPLISPHQQYVSASASSSSSTTCSSLLMPQLGSPAASYLARQFQLQPPAAVAAADAAGTSVDFRVVNPPRRPHSGIWFTLQASQNQAKEPFLPQISKSFLRIKDGRMTVRLLIKYLANKLRLDNESEIEITCRGQQLLPYLTLQHVRDSIWAPTLTLLPDSSTTDHVMVLHYSRSSSA